MTAAEPRQNPKPPATPHLETADAHPLPPHPTLTRKARPGQGAATGGAFGRGVAALAQYLQREGRERPVPRKHEEPVDVDGQEHVVKLGVWLSNTKSRRDRLTQEQRETLVQLGVEWA